MGTCQTRSTYTEGNMDLDTQPLPRQRIERTQPYPYFQFKNELVFRGRLVQKPNIRIEIPDAINYQMRSSTLYEEQQSLKQHYLSDISERPRLQSLQQQVSYSPSLSSRCSDPQKKSNLKQVYMGMTSPKTPIAMSKFGQKKKVRFAKGTNMKFCTQRSISQQEKTQKKHRKW